MVQKHGQQCVVCDVWVNTSFVLQKHGHASNEVCVPRGVDASFTLKKHAMPEVVRVSSAQCHTGVGYMVACMVWYGMV